MEGELTAASLPPSDAPPLLAARGIVKQFPGVRALDGVDFDVRAGEVHALMGENGAGKTTLIRVLTGATHPDAGSIVLMNQPMRLRSPAEAQRAGIAAVYQEIDVIPQLSVAENIMLGREPTTCGLIRTRERDRRARRALGRVGAEIDLRLAVRLLPIAARQMVAIARALDMQARLLVLDEPTSCLDAAETSRLFDVVRALKTRGLGIVFITHFIDQALIISDRITVLRNGLRVGCFEANALSRLNLVSHMLGRPVPAGIAPPGAPTTRIDAKSPVALRAAGLGRLHAITPFHLAIERGEAVGLAGLLGSGRSEAARLIFGADRADTGDVYVGGKRLRRPSPIASLRAGVGMVPESRKEQGLIPSLSLEENIILAVQAKRGWLRSLRRRKQAAIVQRAIKEFGIVGPRRRGAIGVLSGGNQQKAILARWLATNPEVMILDEPMRGIDVGAKGEIEGIIGSLRRQGLSLLFISSELEEVSRAVTRILILRDRAIVSELAAASTTTEQIMRAIAGDRAS